MNQLISIFYIFHIKTVDFTFFSRAYGTFSRKDHILGHKSNLDKLEKKIVVSIFSDHNAIQSHINYRGGKDCKKHKHLEAKQYAYE